jgi:hypothetical protein
MRWLEIPIDFRERPAGSTSKLRTVSDGTKVLLTIFNMVREFRPLGFFGTGGLIACLIGLALGLAPVLEYFETGLVLRFPTLIVAVLFLVVAFVLWAIGLICDLINKKHRQLFEINLNLLRK